MTDGPTTTSATATGTLRILVAVDLSPATPAVLERARELAGARGELRLFHAVPTTAGPYAPPLIDLAAVERADAQIVERARLLLDDRARDLRKDGVAVVDVAVAIGRPADEILAAAERSKADLIVVGAHGKSAARRFFLGTVSEEVARRSSIPVLVAHDRAPGARFQRVLVAVDHEAASYEAALTGARVAASLGLPIEALHVIELPVPAAWQGPFPQPLQELTPELVREVRAAVTDGLSTALPGAQIPVRFLSGSTDGEILRHARPGDLLVCGTHGRGLLGRLAFGSVATRLLRNAPCPVLVVRPRERAR